jgi:hypothetical protein
MPVVNAQGQTDPQAVEYDPCRGDVVAVFFQLPNETALALDQCAEFLDPALCLWRFHGAARDFGKSQNSVFEGGPGSAASCQPPP